MRERIKMHRKIKDSFLVFDEEGFFDCVWDYKEYVLSLLEECLRSYTGTERFILLFMTNIPIPAPLGYRVIRIGINFEHTLIHPGVKNMEINLANGDVCIRSRVALPDGGGEFLLRLINYKELLDSDVIIDYSSVNTYNISYTHVLWEYENKMIRLSPFLYDIDWTSCVRSIDTLTTFVGRRDRRDQFLRHLRQRLPQHTSVTDVFDPRGKQELYRRTKIMLNIHQCLHHNTFEEIRVLPSLLCGTLIISEDTPLRQVIPYQHMVIWCSPEEVVERTVHVLDHYEEYWHQIFTGDNRRLLEGIRREDRASFQAKLFTPVDQ